MHKQLPNNKNPKSINATGYLLDLKQTSLKTPVNKLPNIPPIVTPVDAIVFYTEFLGKSIALK